MGLSCKKATEIVEKKNVLKLSISEKLNLTYHLILCKTCRAYKKHSKMMDKLFSKTTEVDKLENPELKMNILNQLKNQI